MLYFDTSALVKLVVLEAETPALRRWLAPQSVPWVTSVIGAVELRRVAARVSSEAVDGAVRLLARVDQLATTPSVLNLAGQLPPASVRTLDALHIASAAQLADLVAVVSYDVRMAEAARGYGLTVAAPV